MNSIGDRLREERSRLEMNQDDLSKAGGVHRTAQSNYERGDRMPDAAYLALVASAGVDVLYVVTGEKRPSVNDLVLYGDAWEALERELQAQKRDLDPSKKRQAAEHLFEALKDQGIHDKAGIAKVVARMA